ncbi:MAG: hypothetical protein EOP04_18550, partial [Proteobacteria bacterium]
MHGVREEGIMLSTQLEQFLKTAQELENQLQDERRKNQRIARDYLQTRHTLESAVKQLQERLRSREALLATVQQSSQGHQDKEKKYESLITNLRTRDEQMQRAIDELRKREQEKTLILQSLTAKGTSTEEELSQYKTAWPQVMERDSEARRIIAEKEKWAEQVHTHRSKAEELKRLTAAQSEKITLQERHLIDYQKELQSSLIR